VLSGRKTEKRFYQETIYLEVRRREQAMDIQKAWEPHISTAFPSSARGVEIDGVDLVLLDSSTAGFISTFVASGRLASDQVDGLRTCLALLADVVAKLPSDSRAYFGHLADLGRAVFERAVPQSDRA
jgi:hypothetical protein